MVCHIQLFTAGAFLPVLGFVIFPRFIMDAVLMPDLGMISTCIFTDRAVTLSGTRFSLGGLFGYFQSP